MDNLNSTTAGDAVETLALVDKKGNPTEHQVAQWVAAHGEVKCFEVGDRQVYFKQPTRQLVKAANAALAKSRDVDAYQETILKNTQLNYQAETESNVQLFFALANKVDEIITSLSATLKN
ncbi:hypothetical protein IC235_17575 [Hymenobacter sp. BT664]|uniref:Uncharacterized protein n=1 Tax=Hymenobacter montanus TaxID=2771359 RepID=A0A927GKL1_9BACT|nr:hypothetical protein [Hymenobacter montanus]MBD2769703.1 hypothetical protein [Hymenobacter montanus]